MFLVVFSAEGVFTSIPTNASKNQITGKLGMSSSVVIIPRQFFSQGNGGPNKIMAKPGMSSDPNENQTRLRTKATRCGGTHNACFAYKSVLFVSMLV